MPRTAYKYAYYNGQRVTVTGETSKTPITKANYLNKISGSLVENPHVAKWVQGIGLKVPTDGTLTEVGTSNTNYTKISAIDGTVNPVTTAGNTYQSQQLFSFNLIHHIERKYNTTLPGTTAQKVQWLKDNIAKITANWHGFGSYPTGNKATFRVWAIAQSVWGAFNNPTVTTSGTVSRLSGELTTTINNTIDSSGFIHFLAYADPSNGTIASTINTDFIELDVELKPGIVFTKELGTLQNPSFGAGPRESRRASLAARKPHKSPKQNRAAKQ